MMLLLQVITVLLVAVAMAMALAHALELPGKMRLDKNSYAAVQTIYYPGFTIGGLVGEFGGMLATLILLVLTPTAHPAFPWVLASFVALIAAHLAYWLITHPVNKFWLRDQDLRGAGAAFFSFDPLRRTATSASSEDIWKRFRNRWEYSHVVRAVLAIASLIAIVTAVAIG